MNAPTASSQFSKAEEYVKAKQWGYRPCSQDQLLLDVCPFKRCDKHFYINASGTNIDGLFDCKKCGETGNLIKLMASQGDRQQAQGMNGVMSLRDASPREKEEIPDINACHRALMEDEEALDYLVCTRNYTVKVIERQKLGLCMRAHKDTHWKEVKTLVIPHLDHGAVVWVKYRTLPPAPKAFDTPKNWEATLYNEECITKDMEELILVEGEGNPLALMSKGIDYVVGAPGANTKKAMWLDKIDTMNPKKKFILYDSDKVGQRAAQELAKRIGIEKCHKLVLPPFKYVNDDGVEKDGKDINEWFKAGHTIEEFQELKNNAKLFDVEGVQSAAGALDDLEDEILERGSLRPTYLSPWKSLDMKIGGFEKTNVIDIIAAGKIGKSTLVMNILEYLVATYNESAFLYCLEMPNRSMARKWASHVTQTDDTPGKSLMTIETIRTAKAFAQSREAELLFGNTRIHSVDDVYETIRQVVRRYGVKFVGLDNLQLLADHTLKNQSARTVHISQISKNLKMLATELEVVLFRIIQPTKLAMGEIVSSRNADGASQIEKDCDAMIALNRNKKSPAKQSDLEAAGFRDEVQSFGPQLFTNVDLSRYAPGGETTLWFDGATSTVREFDRNEMNSAAKHTVGMGVREAAPVDAPQEA